MADLARSSSRARAVLLAATSVFLVAPASAQVLPWEIAVAEIEAGRIRNLAERLSKQNLLYQLHLGDVRMGHLEETAAQMDRVVEALRAGSASYSIPPPWTPALRGQIETVEDAWEEVRSVALADRYRFVARDFAPLVNRSADPLLLRYFDDLGGKLIAESETLIDLYHEECRKTDLGVCPTARTSGYAAMIIERATKHAVYLVAGIHPKENRAGLGGTLEAYRAIRRANDENPFFAAALDPKRGSSATAAGELLSSLRQDWDALAVEFRILAAGDETNFDLRRMLEIQARLVNKVERLTAALVRYASRAYGS
jgi:hypothetical protein